MTEFVILFAAVLLCFAAAFFLLAHRIEHWPTASGIVAESGVRVVQVKFRGSATDKYKPVIVYDYVVDGIAYRGQERGYATGSESERALAEAVVAAYPVGGTVRVLFNPADPRDAYLEPGNAGSVGWFCVIAAGAVIAFRCLFVWMQ